MYRSKLLESLFLEIRDDSGNEFIIGGIYKHPRLDTREFVTDYLSEKLSQLAQEKYKKVVLLGDFNINLLEYGEKDSLAVFIDAIY